ncbi:MAG TPA: GNAT family N-acetyltransferase [Candidatus Baltobacteraceae bacterium]|nr:GNAT family N-acetyltransferase [Candidatus Baltobacteraceae bacterium]
MILTTDRLTLREPEDADAEIVRDYYRRNAERFMPWDPPRGDDVAWHRAWIDQVRGRRYDGKPTVFLAFDGASGGLVAVVDLHGFTRDGDAMIAYSVDGAYEGKGYASEAVAATIAYAADAIGVARLSAYYDPANARSERLLERAGFTVVMRTPVVPGFERLMRVQNVAVRTLRS